MSQLGQTLLSGSGSGLRERLGSRLTRFRLHKYVLAIVPVAVATALATAIRLVLDPILGSAAPFMLFELAVMVSALLSGLEAGILATVVGGLVCDYLFLEPRYSFALAGHSGLALLMFACVGAAVNLLAYRVVAAESQTAAANRALEQANEDLRDSQAMLELAQSAAGSGLWEWRLPTNEVRWSRSFRELYKMPPEVEANYQNWIALVHPEDRERVRSAMLRATEEHGDLNVEFRSENTGAERWFAVIGKTSFGPDGRPIQLAGIALDITAHKRMERVLEQSNEDLQRFAYAVSHDLSEPLRTVGGYCQLLARRNSGKLDVDSDQFLGFILDGVDRMQRLIKGLLNYSRVTYSEGESVLINATTVLEKVLQQLSAVIRESGAKVTFDPLPVVSMDPERLLQVFQNLVTNAVKYRGSLPPEIHVSAARRGEEWVFSVQDNGIGIDMRQAERIFGVFQRLHSQSEYEGVGVGLATVKRIIERRGGRVWVESEPGKGSTFLFSIPAEDGGGTGMSGTAPS